MNKTFTYDDKMECLLDVWTQFACDKGTPQKGLWAGGLSMLEDVEMILFTENWIDQNGNPCKRNAAEQSVPPTAFGAGWRARLAHWLISLSYRLIQNGGG